MSRKIDWFIPVLFVSYVILSLLINTMLAVTGAVLPVAASYFISEGMLLLPTLVYVTTEHGFFKDMPWKRLHGKDLLLSFLIGLCLIPLTICISSFSMLFSQNYLNESAEKLLTYPYFGQLCLVAVLPAVVEEFLFRGVIYGSYKKNGVFSGAALSGLIFGLIHLNLNQFSYAVVMGFLFALMVEATGSLLSSMFAHFAFNSYSITVNALLRLVKKRQLFEQTEMTTATPAFVGKWLVLVLFVAVFLYFAYRLFRCLAMRNGTWGLFQQDWKKEKDKSWKERKMALPVVATICSAFVFMIYLEMAG